jgi:hypothetical protein
MDGDGDGTEPGGEIGGGRGPGPESDSGPGVADGAAVVGDLVARERRGDRPALLAPAVDRSYSWFDLCTTAYKSGNVLRFLGVREGSLVEVAPDPLPEPVLAFLGAAQLGAATRFEPRGDGEARAVLVPVEREGAFDPPAGTKLAVHGGPPAAATTTHWEAEVWSENPAVHPATVSSADVALRAGGRSFTHAELLAAAVEVTRRVGLGAGEAVALRESLSDPGVVVAGVLAPLYVGGCVVVGPGEEAYDVGVASDGAVPESRVVDPAGLL